MYECDHAHVRDHPHAHHHRSHHHSTGLDTPWSHSRLNWALYCLHGAVVGGVGGVFGGVCVCVLMLIVDAVAGTDEHTHHHFPDCSPHQRSHRWWTPGAWSSTLDGGVVGGTHCHHHHHQHRNYDVGGVDGVTGVGYGCCHVVDGAHDPWHMDDTLSQHPHHHRRSHHHGDDAHIELPSDGDDDDGVYNFGDQYEHYHSHRHQV